MIYLKEFKFANLEQENDFRFNLHRTCYTSIYPFGILTKHFIEKIEFEPTTIFYGGNGSGKSTALNIISEKLKLERDTLYNKSNFFGDYLLYCKYDAYNIPEQSRIITSDDVFDFTMNLRHLNQGIDMRRDELIEECISLKAKEFRFKSIDDYAQLKKVILSKKGSQSEYVRQNIINNVREHSNGESAFLYFTDKIQENALYLLDEPENSLSPEKQKELLQFIQDSVRFYNCQFVIATHSPFLLSLKEAKIYDFDENPVRTKVWTELKNVRDYYDFFKEHEKEFLKPVEKIETLHNFSDKSETAWRRLLNRDNYSELGKKVFDRLKKIWNQEDFIVGTMLILNTEEKLQKMYDFLIRTGTNDSDEVIPYSIKIAKGQV